MAGSVRERKPGVWELRYRNKSRTFRGGQRAAERAMAQMVTDLAPAPRAPQGTVGAVLERFMERAELSPTTRREYDRIIAKRLLPKFGTVRVENLTTGTLSAYYDTLKATLGASSIRQVHTVMSSAFKMAKSDDEVHVNPVLGARVPGRQAAEISTPTVDEVKKMVANAEPRISRAVRVLAGTGMRRGELLAVRWQDLSDGLLHIRHSVAVVKRGQLILKSTKTKQTRLFPLEPVVIEAMEEFPHREGFVFSDTGGEYPWNPDWLTGSIRRLAKSAGVSCTVHGLRHFFVTEALKKGMQFEEVAQLVGHADSRMTLNTYRAATRPEHLRRVAQAVGDLLSG